MELYQKIHPSKPHILFIGGVHGDEPAGVQLAQDLLLWLIDVEKTHPSKINASWTLIPCLNVDGFKKKSRVNGNLVDLNRNFPSHDWNEYARAPRYYPGPRAESEIEVKSLVQLIDQTQPQVIIHFHSWKPAVIYTGAEARPYAELFASADYPPQDDIGHPTPGSLGQYGWYQKKIPVVCIEEKDGTPMESVWAHFEKGFERLLL
ncbi:MAG: M14 family zinc carboxypeptidase [Pseudobdellovibrionaceae bacterium]